jgi:hypothetical protein
MESFFTFFGQRRNEPSALFFFGLFARLCVVGDV